MAARSASQISLKLRLWVETYPEVPDGDWYKGSGSFKICRCGSYPVTSWSEGKLQSVNRSYQSASADSSSAVGHLREQAFHEVQLTSAGQCKVHMIAR